MGTALLACSNGAPFEEVTVPDDLQRFLLEIIQRSRGTRLEVSHFLTGTRLKVSRFLTGILV